MSSVLPETRSVFSDPSGRRWRRISLLLAVLLVPLVVLGGVTVVRALQPPALPPGSRVPPHLTADQVGTRLPVVGTGPLLRVVEVESAATARDPFSGEAVSLTPDEVKASGSSRYVVQRYGYAPGTERTISLTFDDGPDPRFTPRLLDVLSQAQVPATFFLIGGNAARHQDVVHRMVAEGHAVGNHTLTHADLTEGTDLHAREQVVVTDRVLRAVTGQATRSFRLPYGGPDDQSVRDSLPGILRAQRLGYVVTGYDFDTLDWEHETDPGKGPIPLPPLDGGNVTVLLHDGGGHDREATVRYVRDELIPAARAAGYRFTTMPQAVPALAAATEPVSPSLSDRVMLTATEMLVVWPNRVIEFLFLLALTSVAVVGLGNVALALLRRQRRPRFSPHAPALPVSVLIAAYNEEQVIGRTLRTILASRYPLLEVVVVDDGSQDETAERVLEVAASDARVRLLRQDNAGKWAALNHGLEHVRGDYVVTLDADTVFTDETVGNLVRQFGLPGRERLGAVAGVVRVGNRSLNLLTRWQALEYLTQIGIERAAFAQLGAIPIIPGACAAWRSVAVRDAGGYTAATLAEDCDLTLSLHRAGWQVAQDDEAVAYTEAPDHVDALLQQRIRWTFGTLQAIWKHRDMMLRPRHRMLGLAVLPYMTLSIVVPILFLPFIAFMAVVAVQHQGWHVVAAYALAFMAVHALVAAVGVRLMHERWTHLAMIPVYRLVYEPLRAYLLYTSVYLAVRGVRMGWNKLARTGSLDAAVTAGTTETSTQLAEVTR